MSVDPSGMLISRPRNLKLKSPGSLPKPKRRRQGASQLSKKRAKTVMSSQRIFYGSQRMAAVALGETDQAEVRI